LKKNLPKRNDFTPAQALRQFTYTTIRLGLYDSIKMKYTSADGSITFGQKVGVALGVGDPSPPT
jgi:hypothetical protein